MNDFPCIFLSCCRTSKKSMRFGCWLCLAKTSSASAKHSYNALAFPSLALEHKRKVHSLAMFTKGVQMLPLNTTKIRSPPLPKGVSPLAMIRATSEIMDTCCATETLSLSLLVCEICFSSLKAKTKNEVQYSNFVSCPEPINTGGVKTSKHLKDQLIYFLHKHLWTKGSILPNFPALMKLYHWSVCCILRWGAVTEVFSK